MGAEVMCRSTQLSVLAASKQALEGVIPPFAATLHILSLQNNAFKIMSDVRFSKSMNSSVLVHNNLLSCHLPRCGNATAKVSLSGLGNQLSCPKRGFPKWVVPIDRDRLFWVRDREGFALLMKLFSACSLLVVVVASRVRGRHNCLALSRWHAQAGLGAIWMGEWGLSKVGSWSKGPLSEQFLLSPSMNEVWR